MVGASVACDEEVDSQEGEEEGFAMDDGDGFCVRGGGKWRRVGDFGGACIEEGSHNWGDKNV